MKKTLRSMIGLLLALVVTSASAVQIGCPGLERAPIAAQSSVNAN